MTDRAYHDTYYVVSNWPVLLATCLAIIGVWSIWRTAILRLDPALRKAMPVVLAVFTCGLLLCMSPLAIFALALPKPSALALINGLTTLGAAMSALAIAATVAIFVLAVLRRLN